MSDTSATVTGSVDAAGQSGTSYHFEYGTSTAYGNSTPDTRVRPGSGAQLVAATISNLAPGTVYHYRLVAVEPGGTAFGGDATFTTTTSTTTTTATAPADLVTNFQSLPLGTILTDQFRDLGGPNHGVLFNSTAPGLSFNPAVITDAGDGSRVAKITDRCNTAGAMQLPIPRDQITLNLGAFRTGTRGTVPVTLAGYDDHGRQLGTSKVYVPQDSTFNHPVSFGAPGIAFARVTSSPAGCGVIGMHEVKVKDVLKTVPPYFVLKWLGGVQQYVQIKRGESSGPETVTLKRFWGSKGPVTFAVSGLPKGVEVAFKPTGPTNADQISLTVSATKDAPLGTGSSITVSAKGGPAAGTGAPITIPLNFIDQFDVQLTGLEVTQGVQSLVYPTIVGPGAPPPYKFSYGVGDLPTPTAALLVSGGITIVRMYAQLLAGPSEGVSGLSPTLTGFAQGSNAPLPGSPLSLVLRGVGGRVQSDRWHMA